MYFLSKMLDWYS